MAKLLDVNTTDIVDAIALGCRAMGNAFNGDDADVPYAGATVRPEASLGGSFEAHTPGRHLNALLNAEDVTGIEVDEDVVEKHARAAFFSFSQAPLPLRRIGKTANGGGIPIELQDHDLREGLHALYALSAFRSSTRAKQLAVACIDVVCKYWLPNEDWDVAAVERDLPVKIAQNGYKTFIQRQARAIGPLVKFYRTTGYGSALELAIALKEKALRECFLLDGAFEARRFGDHTHSTTCVLSSLAQLADLLRDSVLMDRVKQFYDNGLWDLRNEIGWSVEGTDPSSTNRRGEANNTGDIIETALILGRWGHTECFHDAERILRGHLLPSQLRDVSFIVEPDNPEGVDGRKDVAQRLKGGFGFPAPYGHEPVGIYASDKPRIGFNLDIVGGVIGSLCEAWREAVRFDAAGHWVNLLFDRQTENIEVRSPYTHPYLAVRLRRPGVLHVRLPPWVDGKAFRISGSGSAGLSANGYITFAAVPINRWITFAFELPAVETTLRWRDMELRVRLRGDEVIAMDDFGTDLTFFPPID